MLILSIPHVAGHIARNMTGSDADRATHIVACFERVRVNLIDMISGITTLIAVYWVFYVKHSGTNKKTLAITEHF